MIQINPYPEREKLSDEKVFCILKDICKARSEKKIRELKRLLSAIEGKSSLYDDLPDDLVEKHPWIEGKR